MKICIAQIKSEKGNLERNIDNHLKLINHSIKFNSDLIIFPELSITNYEPKLANNLAVNLEDKIFHPFQELSDNNEITIGIGVPTNSSNGICISLLIFQPKKSRLVYSKQILHSDELPYFVCGEKQIILNIKQNKIAIGICYETLQKEHFISAIGNGTNIYIASVAKSKNGVAKAYNLFPKIANEFRVPILMSNCIGFCDNFKAVGQSAVWSKKGEIIAKLDNENQGLLFYDTMTELTEIDQPKIEKGQLADLEKMFEIYCSGKEELNRNGIYQWTDNYPTKSIIENDLKKDVLYILKNNKEILGAISLSEEQEYKYKTVKWKFNNSRALVIHRLVVDPKHQKKGYAKRLMDFAEKYAHGNNYSSIRLDAYSKNIRVIELYKKRNYFVRGEIYFPERKFSFYCMEKEIINISKS